MWYASLHVMDKGLYKQAEKIYGEGSDKAELLLYTYSGKGRTEQEAIENLKSEFFTKMKVIEDRFNPASIWKKAIDYKKLKPSIKRHREAIKKIKSYSGKFDFDSIETLYYQIITYEA